MRTSPRVTSAHSTPQLRCDVAPDRDVVTVIADGELDRVTTAALDATLRELREAGFGTIRLDLRSLGFVDVAGTRLLQSWWRRAHLDAFELTIEANPVVERTLQLVERAGRWHRSGM